MPLKRPSIDDDRTKYSHPAAPVDQNLRKRYHPESPYIVAIPICQRQWVTGLKASSPKSFPHGSSHQAKPPLSGFPEQAVESEKPNTSPSTRTQMPGSKVSIPWHQFSNVLVDRRKIISGIVWQFKNLKRENTQLIAHKRIQKLKKVGPLDKVAELQQGVEENRLRLREDLRERVGELVRVLEDQLTSLKSVLK